VRSEGNLPARALVTETLAVEDRNWRGLGHIPASGWGLRPELARFDAQKKFALGTTPPAAAGECISGEIMRGIKKPHDCPAFGSRCTPENPIGAPMVSSEGACAAYYRYRHRAVAA
jgi:hydrogenase expression/formation protein HypD